MTSDTVAGAEAASSGSGPSDNAAQAAADVQIVDALAHALVDGALPGELAEFTDADRIAAAQFIAACAYRRPAGTALVLLLLHLNGVIDVVYYGLPLNCLYGGGVAAVVACGVIVAVWRCPACGAYLGQGLTPARCEGCGARLS